jgi:hypothetical protein
MLNSSNSVNWFETIYKILLVAGSLLGSIYGLIKIIRVIKNRSKIKWYTDSDSKNPVILRITNMTDRNMNILGLFYNKDFILDKKDRKTEEMIVNAIHSTLNKSLRKESYTFKRKRKNIKVQCVTDPSLENIQLDSNSSKRFILKNNLLEEDIKSIFLKDTTGEEWDMPAKIFRETRELLIRNKIQISAKIVDEDNKLVKNRPLFVFEVVNDKPDVQFGDYGDVLSNVYKGSASTNKKGNIHYYLFKSTLKEECKYTIGNGKEFIIQRKIFSKKKDLYVFGINQDSTKKEIKLGKVKLEQIKNKENKK